MSGKEIGVDCQFEIDGSIHVRRIFVDGRWQAVSQGRQWIDHLGRHVLVMFGSEQAREIRLQPDTMTWQLLPLRGGHQTRLV
ncbi:MAG: hypothetical protein PVH18_01170 [Chloroflexota bacterium]|jgi:hypothetical protein